MEQEGARRATVFETSLGVCVIGWSRSGVFSLTLQDSAHYPRTVDPALLRAGITASPSKAGRPRKGHGPILDAREKTCRLVAIGRAPRWVRQVITRIAGHFEGNLDDFLDVPLDLPAGTPRFNKHVWNATREVPPGATMTYGEVAEEAGYPGAARAAGNALRRCPITLLIPAHRIIAAGKRLGGWTGPGGVAMKLRLLEIEGVGPQI